MGCSAFARRYLRNRFFFLFLWLLRCFSSPGWLGNLGINARLSATPSLSQTSTPNLSTPRHPPHALSSLTTNIEHSICLFLPLKTSVQKRFPQAFFNVQDHIVTMLEFFQTPKTKTLINNEFVFGASYGSWFIFDPENQKWFSNFNKINSIY